MGKIRRKFDIQFKIQVCQAIETGTHTVRQICQEHQLQRPTVECWLKKHVSGSLSTSPSNRGRESERENEKFKAKVGELIMTIDVLKKIENWKSQLKIASSSIITSRNLVQFQPPVTLFRPTYVDPFLG
ncbi:MAG: transposase, partial [Bdellovibrionia bacterium]